MQLLNQTITQRKSLYIYHVPDQKIIDKWGSLEKFRELIVKNDSAVLLWLQDVMPKGKGVGKFFTDESTQILTQSWDILLQNEVQTPPKKKGKK